MASADMTRTEVARLQKKAERLDTKEQKEKIQKRGWSHFFMLEGTAFGVGYARGRIGDGDSFVFGSVRIPLDLIIGAAGIAFGLKKGRGSSAAMAVGSGALASFLSHEGNKIGQRAKQKGNLIGAGYGGFLPGASGLIGNQYTIVGSPANAGMGAGGGGSVSNYARQAW